MPKGREVLVFPSTAAKWSGVFKEMNILSDKKDVQLQKSNGELKDWTDYFEGQIKREVWHVFRIELEDDPEIYSDAEAK
mgnify:CR=1 FL=1